MSKRQSIDRVRDALSSTGNVLGWADEDSIDSIEAELEDLRDALVEFLETDDLDPSELGALLVHFVENQGMSADFPSIGDHARELTELVQEVAYDTFASEPRDLEQAAHDLAEDLDALYTRLDGDDSTDGNAPDE